jgi:hypothetical protein
MGSTASDLFHEGSSKGAGAMGGSESGGMVGRGSPRAASMLEPGGDPTLDQKYLTAASVVEPPRLAEPRSGPSGSGGGEGVAGWEGGDDLRGGEGGAWGRSSGWDRGGGRGGRGRDRKGSGLRAGGSPLSEGASGEMCSEANLGNVQRGTQGRRASGLSAASRNPSAPHIPKPSTTSPTHNIITAGQQEYILLLPVDSAVGLRHHHHHPQQSPFAQLPPHPPPSAPTAAGAALRPPQSSPRSGPPPKPPSRVSEVGKYIEHARHTCQVSQLHVEHICRIGILHTHGVDIQQTCS